MEKMTTVLTWQVILSGHSALNITLINCRQAWIKVEQCKKYNFLVNGSFLKICKKTRKQDWILEDVSSVFIGQDKCNLDCFPSKAFIQTLVAIPHE